MKIKTLLVVTVVLFALTTGNSTAQKTPVEYSYEKRIELAKKMLEPIREVAINDQASLERLHYFTGPMAEIDPKWTAKFILDNPAEKDGTLYDHYER